MTLRFATVCSGIEAASTAWKPLGWQPVFFSEIDKFPCAVLAHHYPDVPNHGDMTKFKDWPDADIDVLAGGTPCQSFSNAGLRAGLDDPRGQLMLTFGAIAARYRPRWLVWENVPGVLSSNGGRDFGTFLGMLGQLGYGFAYRVLDAQYFGVAQRRRRVFVVGCLGDWRSAAAVLLERESLRGDPAPRRKAGARSAARPAQSLAIRGREGIASAELGGEVANAILTPSGGRGGIGVGALLQADSADSTDREALLAFGGGNTTGNIAVSSALTAHGTRMDFDTETFVSVAPTLRAGGNRTGGDRPPGTDVDICETLVAHTLHGDGFDASEDGTGRGTPLVPVHARAVAPTLTTTYGKQPDSSDTNAGPMLVPMGVDYTNGLIQGDISGTLEAAQSKGNRGQGVMMLPFDTTQITSAANYSNPKVGDPCHPLAAGMHAPAIAFPGRMSATQCASSEELSPALCAINPTAVAFNMHKSGNDASSLGISEDRTDCLRAFEKSPFAVQPRAGTMVRRLTPEECEKLQGFLPGHTLIPWRKKPASECPDGPRYKSLGNSWAVPVARWIGERIALVDSIHSQRQTQATQNAESHTQLFPTNGEHARAPLGS